MLIRGRLFAPAPRGNVLIEVSGDRVTAIEPVASDAPAPAGALGGPDSVITPGFIDVQVNGAFGQDFSDPSADVALVSRGLAAFGVTAYVATVITSPLERYPAVLDHLAAASSGPDGARLLGVHLEGPFLSPRQPGTHTPTWLREPSIELVNGWLDRAPVRIMTLAPELPGALELVRALVARDVVVSLGHTDASWDQAAAAASAGARMGTHLFNGMRHFDHHHPSVVNFLLSSDLAVGVIADGVHVDRRVGILRGAADSGIRLVVVTDALAGLGMPEGDFRLAGVELVSDGVVGRRPDGTLSGSLLPLDHAISDLITAGMDPEQAFRAVTVNPARVLGLDGSMGSVAVGRTADLVILDPGWRSSVTIVGGQVAYAGIR